jgi:hypothetical protein
MRNRRADESAEQQDDTEDYQEDGADRPPEAGIAFGGLIFIFFAGRSAPFCFFGHLNNYTLYITN